MQYAVISLVDLEDDVESVAIKHMGRLICLPKLSMDYYLFLILDDFGLVNLNASSFSVPGGASSFTLGLQQWALVEIKLYAPHPQFLRRGEYCIG